MVPSSPQVDIVWFLRRFAFELAKWDFLLINHFRVDENVNRYESFIDNIKNLIDNKIIDYKLYR